jgi:hypothetical protein
VFVSIFRITDSAVRERKERERERERKSGGRRSDGAAPSDGGVRGTRYYKYWD